MSGNDTGDPFEEELSTQNHVERHPSSMLGGNYEVLETRKGGMGIVYICRIRRD